LQPQQTDLSLVVVDGPSLEAQLIVMAIHDHIDPGQAIVLAAFSLSLWLLYGVVYNLFFSPLAKFPGPKLAAITPWYEFYWDGIKPGQYYFRIEKMHKEFGTIEDDFCVLS
jgi:hypothetical protein